MSRILDIKARAMEELETRLSICRANLRSTWLALQSETQQRWRLANRLKDQSAQLDSEQRHLNSECERAAALEKLVSDLRAQLKEREEDISDMHPNSKSARQAQYARQLERAARGKGTAG